MRVKLDSNPFSFFDGKLKPNKCQGEGGTQQMLKRDVLMGRARGEDRSLWPAIGSGQLGPGLTLTRGRRLEAVQERGSPGVGSQGLSPVPLELPLLSRFREYLWAFRKENATHFPTSPKVNRDFAPVAFWATTNPSGDFGDCRSRGLQPHHF